MAETQFSVPQGDFDLIRYPPTRDPNLRAWDAADEFLLNHVAEVRQGPATPRVITVNDAFGALTVAMASLSRPEPPRHVRFVSDSHVSLLAMRQNLQRNGLEPLDESATSEPDVVLVKIPKTLALLESQLLEIRERVGPATLILGGGMTRDIHASTLEAFERTIGPTQTSRAKKKARLIFSTLDPDLAPEPSPPNLVPLGLQGVQLVHYPGVFSGKRLDGGTQLLLDNLPETDDGPAVIDLGCGSGALGLAVALKDPAAHVTFIDESHLAILSARESFRRAFSGRDPETYRQPTFRVADCLDGLPGESVDLVLCNPPFHQGRSEADDTAWKMFKGAKRVLRKRGELWVVGNRHLGYAAKLERVFEKSRVMANNPKFQVIRAEK